MFLLDAQHQQCRRQARARATLAVLSLCSIQVPLIQCSEAVNYAAADTTHRPMFKVSDTSSTGDCEQTLDAGD